MQLHRTDAGTYVCVAFNGIGNSVEREISLTVDGKLKILFHFLIFCRWIVRIFFNANFILYKTFLHFCDGFDLLVLFWLR